MTYKSHPMSSLDTSIPSEAAFSDAEISKIIEEHESESPTRKLEGIWKWIAGILTAGLAIYALYWTQYSITTHIYRASFLLLVLVLTFIFYPAARRDRARVKIYDVLLGLAALVSLLFLLLVYESALQRIINPTVPELVMGGILILLVLEATRRTTGIALSLVAVVFLLYAFLGPYIPEPLDHRGYNISRIIGQNYLTLEGIFGVPLDVAATFIVLFTIYGAVLEYSGAGKFFLDWSFAALGKSNSGAGPGRTVTVAGFLLGTVSGSGVATTVTLGSLAWPMLKKGGYDKDTAGGVLSAAGIGATLSPPTLGAAAFIIAEYLDISYLDVIVMAMIPTLLYYLSCFLMIEADSRRLHTHAVAIETQSLKALTIKYGYHFTSLFAVAVLMALGMTPFMAVFWSIVIAFALSFLRPETRLTSLKTLAIGVAVGIAMAVMGYRLSSAAFWGIMTTCGSAAAIALFFKLRHHADASPIEINPPALQALQAGGKSVVAIAATTACAGIIVSITTLTGLGLKLSGLIVGLAGGSVLFTVLFAAIAIWVLGLAVPVTASYIIGAVMIVPAMTKVGIDESAAHMFLFYYAVLADVSPPTALAPTAAAAITGGKPFKTMMMAWKYCLPAFLVPFMFTLSPEGIAILLKGPLSGIVMTTLTSCVAVLGLAVAMSGYFLRPANFFERLLMGVGGLLLMYANTQTDLAGIALLIIGTILHIARNRINLNRAET